MVNYQRYGWGFSLAIACLLLAASLVMAQEAEKSPIRTGGAIGVNYAYGSYDNNDRGEGIGGIDVDVFRLNADLDHQNVIGRLEYRWQAAGNGIYDTYSMIHTAWLGYDGGESGTLGSDGASPSTSWRSMSATTRAANSRRMVIVLRVRGAGDYHEGVRQQPSR